MADHAYRRPPVDERTHRDRTEPVQIKIRTEWHYSEPSPDTSPYPGEIRHAYSRAGDIVESPVTSRYEHLNSISDHVYRAIEAFGDDADLIIEVRRA